MNKAELDHVCSRVAAVFEDEFRQRGWLPAQVLEIPGFTIDALRKHAFGMPPADQYRLACLIAGNVGYVLVEEPEHPDSPHAQGCGAALSRT
jgi:hypothetical protein